MEIAKVEKKYKDINRAKLVRLQIVIEVTILRNMYITESELMIMTLLGLEGEVYMNEFCGKAGLILYSKSDNSYMKSQIVRNRVLGLEKQGLIVKKVDKKKRRTVRISFPVHNDSMLLNYNFLCLDGN